MLACVEFGLVLPTVFGLLDPAEGNPSLEYLSISVAVVLIVLYALYLLSDLRRREAAPGTGEERQPPFGKVASYVLLLGTTAAVAYVSEAFVGAIEPLVEEIGVSELFVGVIVVPIVGNIAEHVVGVEIAYKDNMNFSMAVLLSSSLQVAPS
jgi:Ca2+:H+ antiporter